MNTSSRFQEHFEQDYCIFYDNSSNTSSQLFLDSEDLPRQSLSDTISSSSTSDHYNGKNQNTTPSRHQRQASVTSSLDKKTLLNWCIRQKTKISIKLHL